MRDEGQRDRKAPWWQDWQQGTILRLVAFLHTLPLGRQEGQSFGQEAPLILAKQLFSLPQEKSVGSTVCVPWSKSHWERGTAPLTSSSFCNELIFDLENNVYWKESWVSGSGIQAWCTDCKLASCLMSTQVCQPICCSRAFYYKGKWFWGNSQIQANYGHFWKTRKKTVMKHDYRDIRMQLQNFLLM